MYIYSNTLISINHADLITIKINLIKFFVRLQIGISSEKFIVWLR